MRACSGAKQAPLLMVHYVSLSISLVTPNEVVNAKINANDEQNGLFVVCGLSINLARDGQ
jgi:hypothetical protein